MYNKKEPFRFPLIRMVTNFGRDIVFSADSYYNVINEKTPDYKNYLRKERKEKFYAKQS